MATQIFVILKANKYGLHVHCMVAQMNIHFILNGGFQLLHSRYRTIMWWLDWTSVCCVHFTWGRSQLQRLKPAVKITSI